MDWRKPFMELAVRAVRKVNYDYSAWSIGQQINNDIKPENLNQNLGFLHANETAVCDAITLEFMNSPFTNGVKIDGKLKYYSILREENFKYADSTRKLQSKNEEKSNKRVDLVVNRYTLDNGPQISKIPILIEAKRYHYMKSDILTGKPKSIKTKSESIIKDMGYLQHIRDNKNELEYSFKDIEPETFFIYILIWGLHNKKKKYRKKPSEILEEKFKITSSEAYEMRMIPIKWDNEGEVSDYIWICLAEIDYKNRNGKDTPFTG